MWQHIHVLWSADAGAAFLPVLLDAAVKGTVVLALAYVGTRLLRRSTAGTRHLVWLLAIAGLVVLPVLTVTVPSWRVLPGWMSPREVVSRQLAASPGRLLMPAEAPAHWADAEQAGANRSMPRPNQPEAVNKAASDTPAGRASAGSVRLPLWLSNPAVLLCLVWLGGAVIVLGWMLLGMVSVGLLGRVAHLVVDEEWLDAAEQAREELGIRRVVRLVQSGRRAMPMVWGLVRARLLIPSEALSWPVDWRRVALLHEMAHILRRDCLWQIVAQLACAAYWFHPLVWLARRAMQIESEQACDDIVLQAGSRASDYAEHLLRIASGLRTGRISGAAAIAMARPSRLEGRLMAILDAGRQRRAMTWMAAAMAITLVTGVVVPVAMLKAGAEISTGSDRGTSPTGVGFGADKMSAAVPGKPFVANLSSGGTVELAGICYYPSAGKAWWRPDGSPGMEKFITSGRPVGIQTGPMTREFVIRTTGLPEGASGASFDISPSFGMASSKVKPERPGQPGRLEIEVADFPNATHHVTVKVGIASGAWQTVGQTEHIHGSALGLQDQKGIVFSPVQEKDGKSTVVIAFMREDGAETRAVAVDKNDQLHEAPPSFGGSGGNIAQRTATFDLPAANIKAIRLESRPYEWVTFENVALEPKKAADSQPAIGDLAAGAADRSASGEASPEAGDKAPGQVQKGRAVRIAKTAASERPSSDVSVAKTTSVRAGTTADQTGDGGQSTKSGAGDQSASVAGKPKADHSGMFVATVTTGGEEPSEFSVGENQAKGTGVIRGKVVSDVTGEPIAGAMMHLFRTATFEFLSLRTQKDGSFEFLNVPAGQYSLGVTVVNGYQQANYNPNNTPGQVPFFDLKEGEHLENIVFRLKPEYSITGQVLDEDGKPMRPWPRSYIVALVPEPNTYGKGTIYKILQQAMIGISGDYILHGLDGQPTYVAVWNAAPSDQDDPLPPCYAPGTLSRSQARLVRFDEGSIVHNVDIRLTRKGGLVLEGTVTDAATGEPIPKTLVIAHHTDMLFDNVTAYTDEQGHYRLDTLGEGKLRVHADARPFGYVRYSKEITLPAGASPAQMDFTLARGAEIRGRFVDLAGNDVAVDVDNAYGQASAEGGKGGTYTGPSNRYEPDSVGTRAEFLQWGEGPYTAEHMRFIDDRSFSILGMAPGTIHLYFSPQKAGWKVAGVYRGEQDIRNGLTVQRGETIDDVRVVLDTGGDNSPVAAQR